MGGVLIFCRRCEWFRKVREGEVYAGYADGSPAGSCPNCGTAPLGLQR